MQIKLYDKSLETQVIASFLMYGNKLILEAEYKPSFFYDTKMRAIYTAIENVIKNGDEVNFKTVAYQMEKDGLLEALGRTKKDIEADLVELSTRSVSAGFVKNSYKKKLVELMKKREIYKKTQEALMQMSDGADPDEVLSTLSTIDFDDTVDTGDIKSAIEKHKEKIKEIEEKKEKGQTISGIPTGFERLDYYTDGLKKGQLWSIVAPTNTGKSTFALNIALNIARHGVQVDFFSLEMTKEEIINRLIAIILGVPAMSVARLEVPKKDIEKAYKELERLPLNIFDERIYSDDILFEIKRGKITRNTGVVIIDYIQNIATRNQMKLYDRMNTIVYDLQRMAKITGIPIVFLSQMSNESIYNEEKDEGKGAGEIKAASNVMITLRIGEDKEEYLAGQKEGKGGIINVRIAKNRGGIVTGWQAVFYGDKGIFEEHDPEF